MNVRSRVGLGIGLAAAAGIGVLALGPWRSDRSGEPSAGTNHAAAPVGHVVAAPSKAGVAITPEREAARALTAKRYKAAQHSPHRLEWESEGARPSNVVFDLCDDAEATKAGLAMNALDVDRGTLGIDCRSSENRFGYIAAHEALRFANSAEEAQALLVEYAEKGSIHGEKFDKPVGTLMGHSGSWPVDMGLALDPCGAGFGCATASFDVSRGSTRGLFANVSEDVAHNVSIRAGNVVVHHPLSVQPGESTAFELPAELSVVELETLSITATFVASADPRRGVLLLGAPGDITAPRKELAERYFGIDPAGEPPMITYDSEALMLERSTTHPEAAKQLPGHVLDAPTAVVALLDQRRKVVAVLRPPVTFDADGSRPLPVATMAVDQTYTIGFIVPPDVAQDFISVGGME